MTDDQMSEALALKVKIAATAAEPTGTPKEVRQAVLVLKKQVRRNGTMARELAAVVGIHETTLSRWGRESRETQSNSTRARSQRREDARASGFRVVQLAAPETKSATTASSQAPATPSRGLRVAHAPSGLVIDGLDVETLATLLRRMS